MKTKFTALFVAAILFAGAVSAASVGFTETDEIPESFSGGESFTINSTFENGADRSLPIVIQLNATNDAGNELPVQAFDIGVKETSIEDDASCFGNGFRKVSLPSFSLNERNICAFENVSSDEHYAVIEISSSVRLRPGTYNLELDLMSAAGSKPSEVTEREGVGPNMDIWNKTETGSYSSFSTENTEVWIRPNEYDEVHVTDKFKKPSEPALVLVEELDTVTPEGPDELEDPEFVRGVQVEIMKYYLSPYWIENLLFGGEEARVDSEGNITMEFEGSEVEALDRNTLSLYRYKSSGKWEEISEWENGQSVTAEVDHFSVYALFAEPAGKSGETDPTPEPPTGGKGPLVLDPAFEASTDGLTVEFEDQTRTYGNGIEEYKWEFGDESTGTGPEVSHTYEENGTYSVTLTLTDEDGGEHTGTQQVQVNSSETEQDEQDQGTGEEGGQNQGQGPDETGGGDEQPVTPTGFFAGSVSSLLDSVNSIVELVISFLPF